MLVGIANREDPDQTASSIRKSDLDLHCLSRPFWQPTSAGNFRTFVVVITLYTCMQLSIVAKGLILLKG